MKKILFILISIFVVISFNSCKAGAHSDIDAQYTISYSSEYNTVPENKIVNTGYKITEEDLPELTEEGFIFLGWFAGSEKIETGFCVKKNLSLKAGWKNGYVYVSGDNGGLTGESQQKQGELLKESWMVQETGNFYIGDFEIPKTSEIVVIPEETVATVKFDDDSSWNCYITEDIEEKYKGVFTSGCDVELEAFSMGQFEVTEQFYNYIMNDSTSGSQIPVTNITYKQACAFCNALTKKIFGENTEECVYYSDENLSTVYESGDSLYEAYDKENNKWLKTGYRLPTETEWEFAARGGNPNADYWYYPFAGYNPEKMVINSDMANEPGYNGNGWLLSEQNLKDYMVYKSSLSSVGTKFPNKLGLYDMSGNAWEFCNDKHDGDYNVYRGGSYQDDAYWCMIFYRNLDKYYNFTNISFRICRSLK